MNEDITDSDSLKFSSIGYTTEAYSIKALRERFKKGSLTISLTRSVSPLKQVAITAGKAHVKIAGYDKNSKLFGLGFDASGLGAQAGVVIPIEHPETNLQNINFYIIQNPFKHLVFRINLYKIINGKPSNNNLLTENIYLNVADYKTGKIVGDLSKYNLYFDSDVLLTLEWIEALPAHGKIAVAAAIFGHTWYRQASQSAWTKKNTAIGLSVRTVY